MELLYRPPSHVIDPTQRHLSIRRLNRPRVPFPPNSPNTIISLESGASVAGFPDDPPKYTPPPSYTTATGARIAKMFRNSIRRSVRRIMGEPSRSRAAPPVPTPPAPNNALPDYAVATILANQSRSTVSFIDLDDSRRPFSEPTSLAFSTVEPDSSHGQVYGQGQGQSRSLSRNFDCLMFTNRLGRNSRSAENLVLSEVPLSISNDVLVFDQQNASNDSVI